MTDEQLERLGDLLRSETPSSPVPVVDHPILDLILVFLRHDRQLQAVRESECVAFTGGDGRRYELVVRPIDERSIRP